MLPQGLPERGLKEMGRCMIVGDAPPPRFIHYGFNIITRRDHTFSNLPFMNNQVLGVPDSICNLNPQATINY